jgi:hypothetical protein
MQNLESSTKQPPPKTEQDSTSGSKPALHRSLRSRYKSQLKYYEKVKTTKKDKKVRTGSTPHLAPGSQDLASLASQPAPITWHPDPSIWNLTHGIKKPAARHPELETLWNRSFGVEFEFFYNATTQEEILDFLERNGFAVERSIDAFGKSGVGHTGDLGEIHQVTPGWKVVYDSSVLPKRVIQRMPDFWKTQPLLWEVVSPILYGRQGLQEILKMCKTLQAFGVKIRDRDKGLSSFHVHVGADDLDGEPLSRLIQAYHHLEYGIEDPYINGLLGCVHHRRHSDKAEFVSDIDPRLLSAAQIGPLTFEKANEICPQYDDRWVSLNMLGRCRKYGTVEFRRHEAMVDHDRVLSWVMLCLSLVSASHSGHVATPDMYGKTLRESFFGIGMYHNGDISAWAADYLWAVNRGSALPRFDEKWLIADDGRFGIR